MGKIKLNLVSGAIVEKPLIVAFKTNNISYVVLDNEMNGSMGLPIILVCKLENNKLIKIVDQNEWQIVKEYLKNIIAGSQIEFINIASELSADDIYYTQLTLPVPSFDALKNAYKVDDNSTNDGTATILDVNTNNIANSPNPALDITTPPAAQSEAPNMETAEPIPAVEPTPEVAPTIPGAQVPEPTPTLNPEINPSEPVVDIGGPTINPTPEPTEPVENNNPVIDIVPPVSPSVPDVNNIGVELGEPAIQNPVENDITSPSEESVFKEQKEAFMQACENMFDALVQKFEKELENKKN